MKPERDIPAILLTIAATLCLVFPEGGCKKNSNSRFQPQRISAGPPRPVAAQRPQQTKRRRGRRYPEQITDRDPNSLLGGEQGLDHVGVAVTNLEAADRLYQKLGFGNGEASTLPNGLRNVNFQFADTTYLELLTVTDPKKNPWAASFIDKYKNGAMFLMLCVFAYGETANFLRRKDFDVSVPRPGRAETNKGRDGFYRGKKKPPMWHTFSITDAPPPGDIRFIAYNRGLRNFVLHWTRDPKMRKKLLIHPNTATGIHSTWIAVRHLGRATEQFKRIGLTPTRRYTIKQLDAVAQEIAAGIGTLRLLQPRGRGGPVAKFLGRRGEGILGLGIAVEQLDRARSVIRERLELDLPSYKGADGPSVMVPAKDTLGVWLELTQI